MIAAVLLSGGMASAQVEYLWDDGRGNATGAAFDEWDFVFLNSFDAQSGGDWVTRIRVCWGSARAGIPGEVFILDGTGDGASPETARVRARQSVVTAPSGNGVFQTYELDQPVRVCGTFYVGARVWLGSGGLGVNPARLDPEAFRNADRAFLAVGSVVNPELAIDLEHLGAAPIFRRMDANFIPGVWLVRAVAQPARWCAADFNDDGFVDAFDYDAFVACYEGVECPPCRTADVNGDGFGDFFDYDEFVRVFETGC